MPETRPRVLAIGAESSQSPPGGLTRYFFDLVRELAKIGFETRSVLAGTPQPTGKRLGGADRISSGLASRLLHVRRTAAKQTPWADVVDAHFALYAFLPVFTSRLRKVPLVVHFQGPWADESRSTGEGVFACFIKRSIERAVYHHARELVVLSGAFKRILVERYGVPPWHVTVIPPGVDLEKFSPGSREEGRQETSLPQDAWIVLSVRRLIPRMGLDVLLRSWAQATDERDIEALLLIAGDGPFRGELERLAGELELGQSVRFLGEVGDSSLVSLYRAANLCVVPSITLEGFGLTVLESLACGTPVVATDSGGLPEALSPLDPTLIVNAGDTEALARRIEVAMDGSIPLPTGSVCRSFSEQFNWKDIASRNGEVYQPAASRPPVRKLRVVFLDHSAQLSGGELALVRLQQGLPEIDSHVILAQDGLLLDKLLTNKLSAEVLPMSEGCRSLPRDRVRLSPSFILEKGAALWGSVAYVARLAIRLRSLKPDLIHTNSLKAAAYGGIAGKLAGVPVVWHIRDRISPDYLPSQGVRLVRFLARHLPSGIIANSSTTSRTLRIVEKEGGPKIRVIGDPADKAGPRSRDRDPKPLVVALLGRIAPWKGQDVFIKAFAGAFSGGCEKGVLAGSAMFGEHGYERTIRGVASTLDQAGNLEFAGFVDDVPEFLANIDILVHASTIPEPFGQVVVEGMAAGLPVVAANAGGPAEIIEHGKTGLLYPPGDVSALADAMKTLASDPALRSRLGEAARIKAKEFAPEIIAQKVMDFYRELGFPSTVPNTDK